MARVRLLAKRYAQALFDLALENKVIDQVYADMSMVQSVLEENRNLRKVMHNPVLDVSVKLRLTQAIFGEKKLIGDLSLHFIQLIVKKRREAWLLDICRAFEVLYYDHKNLIKAEIITAFPLDEVNKKDLMNRIKTITHKDVELKEIIDESLVGGFVIRVEDYQFDASIASKLRRLRKTFAENLYVKQF
ncbi:MAG: ATP synthase F1 subunit delta [Bacteroidales bacterium]|nr:ATP synthase F1 subunit delta [Bacteroidales bacterium]